MDVGVVNLTCHCWSLCRHIGSRVHPPTAPPSEHRCRGRRGSRVPHRTAASTWRGKELAFCIWPSVYYTHRQQQQQQQQQTTIICTTKKNVYIHVHDKCSGESVTKHLHLKTVLYTMFVYSKINTPHKLLRSCLLRLISMDHIHVHVYTCHLFMYMYMYIHVHVHVHHVHMSTCTRESIRVIPHILNVS